MFENIINFFKRITKKETSNTSSKDTAKERLHLVLMQDRANVSADFLDLMRQEIIEVIKKYIDIDEEAMDVRLTNQENEDGTQGAPALYANIPIVNIKEKARNVKNEKKEGEETAKETGTKNNKTENKKSEDKNTKDKEEKDKQENANENEKDSETKDVEEKAKRIVKEENSSHNNKEKKHKTEHKNSESEKIDKKESENE